MKGMPEVSLITSWHAGSPGDAKTLPGLQYALKAGLRLFDLYFLNPLDLPWYLAELPDAGTRWTALERKSPLHFAAALKLEEIHLLARALTKQLTGPHYTGRLIGPRPRFVALATYWPLIADDSPEKRRLSIKAIQNSILLAEHLGCEHVEIVGGAAFSGADGKGAYTAQDRREAATQLRKDRMGQLAKSLTAIFSGEIGVKPKSQGRCPKLCVEMEPGSAFLVRDIQTFHELHNSLPAYIQRRVMLNVDLAHMFLADVEAQTSQSPQMTQLQYLESHPEVKDLIGHFHCSDHARSHAADLCPGTYHFWDGDYRPWLKLAAERVGKPGFSNAIAIEMEAVADIHEVTRAIGRTRAWLKSMLAEKPQDQRANEESLTEPQHQEVTGVVMAVDIANSTMVLARGGNNLKRGARRLDAAVSGISRRIQEHRGSVYSFTGDGVVAVFDGRHFLNDEECALAATRAAAELYAAMRAELEKAHEWAARETKHLAVRVAMHWGQVQIPSHGPLKHQVLGVNVIIACRMLALADSVLDGKPVEAEALLKHQMAVSEGIKTKLYGPENEAWTDLPPEMLDDPKRFRGFNWAKVEDDVVKAYVKDGPPVQG